MVAESIWVPGCSPAGSVPVRPTAGALLPDRRTERVLKPPGHSSGESYDVDLREGAAGRAQDEPERERASGVKARRRNDLAPWMLHAKKVREAAYESIEIVQVPGPFTHEPRLAVLRRFGVSREEDGRGDALLGKVASSRQVDRGDL